MNRIQTAKIQERDGVEIYTAHIQKNGDGWIGWMPEIPEVKCEENTKESLLETIEDKLHEVLEARADAWDKQIEEDIQAGRLDHLGDKALEDLRAGRCKDL